MARCDQARRPLFDGPGRREAAGGHQGSIKVDRDQTNPGLPEQITIGVRATGLHWCRTVGIVRAIQHVGNVASPHSLDSANVRGIVARQDTMSKANSI